MHAMQDKDSRMYMLEDAWRGLHHAMRAEHGNELLSDPMGSKILVLSV
jgi:hypothetical protein